LSPAPDRHLPRPLPSLPTRRSSDLAEEVPCGAATTTAMEGTGTRITPATYEDDVRAVLTKVELGEVDAGLVYTTDVHGRRPRRRSEEHTSELQSRFDLACRLRLERK